LLELLLERSPMLLPLQVADLGVGMGLLGYQPNDQLMIRRIHYFVSWFCFPLLRPQLKVQVGRWVM
jgi:hypothetical protein